MKLSSIQSVVLQVLARLLAVCVSWLFQEVEKLSRITTEQTCLGMPKLKPKTLPLILVSEVHVSAEVGTLLQTKVSLSIDMN